MRLFVTNRRDGSRLLSSALIFAFVGLVRSDTAWGLGLLLTTGPLCLFWWHCYRQLKH